MIIADYDGHWYPGMDGGLSFNDIWGKTPEKPSTRKTDPTGDWTRARYVRGNDVTPSLNHSGGPFWAELTKKWLCFRYFVTDKSNLVAEVR